MPFHNLGLLVGLFAPRCTDLCAATRQEAVSCVYSLLYLQLGYEGESLGPGSGMSTSGEAAGETRSHAAASCPTGFSRDYQDEVAEGLLLLKDALAQLDTTDPGLLFHTSHSIAQVCASTTGLRRLP